MRAIFIILFLAFSGCGGAEDFPNPSESPVPSESPAPDVCVDEGCTMLSQTRFAGTGTNGDDGESDWSNPGNITVDDGSVAQCDLASNPPRSEFLTGANFGFSIPTNAIIKGIELNIERRRLSGSSSDVKDSIVRLANWNSPLENKADTVTNWPTSFTVKNYGGSSDLWDSLGSPGTPREMVDKINSSSFGATLMIITGTGGSQIGQVDYMSITVYYDLPGDLGATF